MRMFVDSQRANYNLVSIQDRKPLQSVVLLLQN